MPDLSVTYRQWHCSYDPPPIPNRGFDWQATHKDMDCSYEGPEDGYVCSHPTLFAGSRTALLEEIDLWYEEQADAA